MNKILLVFCILLIGTPMMTAQSYVKKIKQYQKKLTKDYKSPDESPLSKEDRLKFKSFNFYSIKEEYKVTATFKRVTNAEPFEMPTSGKKTPVYEVYGVATFKLLGKEYKLNIYQNHRLRDMEEYKDYLFLPFTDHTNGEETYGGGRYLDLRIPEKDEIVIDFNKAYNPYCAYATGYNCPIPPIENDLDREINAGIKLKTKSKK